MPNAPVSRPGTRLARLSLARAPRLLRAGLGVGLLASLGAGLLGCSNLVPGPYVNPPQQDGGGEGDMRLPERTGTLQVTPGLQQQLTISGGVPATATWRALFTYADTGEEVDVSDICAWSLVGREGQQTTLGSVDRGRFTSTALSAGVGTVRAEFMGQRAEAGLSIKLIATRLSTDDDASAPPADAATRFSGVATASKAPRLLYPPDGAILPTGLGGLMVQWAPQGSTNLHEVRLQAALLDLSIYTSSPQRLSLREADMALLTDAALYGPVTITVRGGNSSGDGSYGTSSAFTLRAASLPTGATYYFSTATPAQGVWRHNWSAPFGSAAAAYATAQTAATGSRCVGCHAVSADGNTFIGSYDMSALGSGTFVDAKLGQVRPVAGSLRWYSSSLSGDGAFAVLSGSGALSQLQSQSGSTAALSSGVVAGVTIPVMPTLTPDGKRLLFVRGRQVAGQSEAHVYGGSIVLMTEQNGTLSGPTDIVAAAGNDNNYYPTLSPDGQWVLFNRTSNATATLADSYDNLTAALWTVPLDKSRAALRLGQANDGFIAQIPTNAAVFTNTSNSFPSFLPFPAQIDGRTIYFFTFASRRNYGGEIIRVGSSPRTNATTVRGKVTPGQDTTLTSWNQQLWIAAFDPQRAAQGLDPSSAALWLPFQVPTSSNHMAITVQAFRGPAL